MTVTLKAGQFGWDYLLVYSDGTEQLVQSSQEYPAAAELFGWDAVEDNYTNRENFINDAQEYLDDHIDETAEIEGESRGGVALTEQDVQFSIDRIDEDTDYRREFAHDQELVQHITDQLRQGNEWAWCTVVVTATWNDLEGNAYLGACSYRSKQDFIRTSGYYEDMKREALADLNRQVGASGATTTEVPSRTKPLSIEFKRDGVIVKHDGSLDEGEMLSLIQGREENSIGILFGLAEGNAVLVQIRPEEINALTTMPMFARPQDASWSEYDGELTACAAVYCWEQYQVTSLIQQIFTQKGAFLARRVINFRNARTGEVVKELELPIEGEWEKDER